MVLVKTVMPTLTQMRQERLVSLMNALKLRFLLSMENALLAQNSFTKIQMRISA